jgi:DNA-binding XRE family transcriptional regulator
LCLRGGGWSLDTASRAVENAGKEAELLVRASSVGCAAMTSSASSIVIRSGPDRDAPEAAGLSRRELAVPMGASQAAVARLEAGGVGATLTTLQKVAAALHLTVIVDPAPAV